MSFLATNPNNWHWKEKNATQWSKEKLNDLLVGLKIENEEYSCEIKELKRCSGEASANNRKAKLVFLVNKPMYSIFFFYSFVCF
jgi:activator of HSP90 ATPase